MTDNDVTIAINGVELNDQEKATLMFALGVTASAFEKDQNMQPIAEKMRPHLKRLIVLSEGYK